MFNGLKLFWAISLIICSLSAFSQNKYQFEHLTSEDGLLDDIAYSIFQDSKGYIWIGTMAGIQRYDGYEFVNFVYDPRNKESGLQESIIRHITEMSDGTIWFGTRGGGVVRYKDGKLLPRFEIGPEGLGGDVVEDIIEDKNGTVWIATNGGLTTYKDGVFKQFVHDEFNDKSISDNNIFSLCEDSNGNIWIGTLNGMNQYLGSGEFRRFYNEPGNKNSLAGNFVHDIFEDSRGNLWVAAVQGGVTRILMPSFEMDSYSHDPNDPASLSNDIALNIVEDKNQNIWVGTWGAGINKFVNGSFERYRNDPADPRSISNDNVEEIMVDNQGNLWTANYLGGVNRYTENKIISYSYSDHKENGMISTSLLRDIIYTNNKETWLITQNGINIYKNGQFEQLLYRPGTANSLSAARANRAFEDSNGTIWIAYVQGDGVDTYRDGRIEHISFPSEYGRVEITDMEEDLEGNMWFTSTNGIIKWNDGDITQYKHVESDPYSICNTIVRDAEISKDGSIWFGTGGGLSQLKDGRFHNYTYDEDDPTSLPRDNIETIAIDGDNNIWVGYVGGLAKLDVATSQFKKYGKEDGLAGTVIEELDVDRNSNLWVATHNGASRYLKEQDRWESFTKKEGFADHKLLDVYCNTNTDRVYFCGPEGFYYYDLNQISNQSRAINLDITDFNLIGDFSNSTILDIKSKVINREEFELTHKQNSFKVNFAALASQISPKYNYSYRLLPMEEEWNFIGNKTDVTFTYLNPGDYTLEVMSKDSSGSSSTTSLAFSIAAPWWRSTWFIILVVLVLGGMVVAGFRWRVYSLRQQRNQLEGEVNRRTADLKSIISIIKQNSDQITNTGLRLKQRSGQLASDADTQSKTAKLIEKDIEDITSNTKKNNENATITQEISSTTVEQLGQIKDATQRNVAEIKRINEKIQMLEEIFNQTNILAINASIEAARAGHNGTGFAVIAGEVRKLAQRSKEASTDIIESAKTGALETERVGKLIMEFIPEVQKSAELIKQISTSSEKQNISIENINLSLKDFFMSSEKNSEFSNEIFSISKELDELVSDLNDKVKEL